MPNIARVALLALVLGSGATMSPASADPITSRATAIEKRLDGLDLADRWPAGVHIDWRSGLPDGSPERMPGRHTHCSAFVAAAAEALGIYILRPPEHGQVLLANAQSEWLASDGAAVGWRPVEDGAAAQALANKGALVVASYHSLYDDRPGHIAIVLPGNKSPEVLAAEGPDVMQAGTVNSTRIPLRDGFAGHRGAFTRDRILFYAHSVNLRD